MITVDKVIEKTKNADGIVNEQNEELLKTGRVKAAGQSYWLYVFLAAAALTGAYFWYKKGKESNGAISG